ncbi:hypothetical protein CDAR_566831 [Caerostris darwini]|uniref:Uncharacterized protein n=1 Tax=Caerostris darwini TaxID=1538125 RepID=A0AAV4VZP8_9ARAC|nr:hypothetical protein CDAR_566831 [Caerostris darwini]
MPADGKLSWPTEWRKSRLCLLLPSGIMLVEMKILLISRPVVCHLQHYLPQCGPEFLYNECSFHPESSVPTLNDSVSTLNDLVPEERCCVQSTIAANHLPN